MIGWWVKKLLGKELILYNPHRQSLPVATNEKNKQNFLFVSDKFFWRVIPFRSSNKWKFRFMFFFLNVINPKIILDINWIGTKGALYHLWAKKHRPSKFVVLQHGLYIGGIVTDIPHRYTCCDEFLTWGNYFTEYFTKVNAGKSVLVKTFGNSVYNELDRDVTGYPTRPNLARVLVAPSAVSADKKEAYIKLLNHLDMIGLEVFFKPHNMQFKIGGHFELPEFVKKGDVPKIWDEFDFLISDISSILMDAIYRKKRILFYMPEDIKGYHNSTYYSKYLSNIEASIFKVKSKQELIELVNIENQEKLLNSMITKGNNLILNVRINS